MSMLRLGGRTTMVYPSRAHLALLVVAALLVPAARALNFDIVNASKRQIGVTRFYDPSYRKLAYPNGDVPDDRGVCTDVVIRALRVARSLDLQVEVHRDMSAARTAYPTRWFDLTKKTDRNIDHRRVPNQMTYFARRGFAQPITRDARSYLPGDIVAWDLGGGTLHIGIVSDTRSATRVPLVVHNIGRGAREDDILFRYRIIGHYRLPPTAATQ
jgi:uncharacterized protein